MTAVAELDEAWKHFGEVVALAGVSFQIEDGQVAALLGPNGAGKTTAISLLLGLRAPDRGSAHLFGSDPKRSSPRRRLGVTPQDVAFPPTVTVDEVIDLVRRHHLDPYPTGDVLERFGLAKLRRRKAGGLSSGERRRLALALAFAGRPDLVILDEPTAGLDLEARHLFWQTLREFNRGGGAILLTTHYLEEAETLAERVVVLNRGRVIAAGSVSEVAGSIGITRVRFEARSLPALPGIVHAERDGDAWVLDCRDSDAVVRRLVGANVPFRALQIRAVSLEEAFLALTAAP